MQAVRDSGVRCVHDIPMVKSLPPFARVRAAFGTAEFGHVVAYHHVFGMTFPMGFPVRDLWPERFDPPAISGGGEMTNMGCYAIDYMVTLLGSPRAVQAKRQSFWQEYAESPVGDFGQIVCDYGRFYAVLTVGKQKLTAPLAPTMNTVSIVFQNANLLVDPVSDTITVNGIRRSTAEFVGATAVEGSLDQLIRCIETGVEPLDTVEQGRRGMEVLMAAYRSAISGGERVLLPLGDGLNPLVG
ncbi:MAG TPA: hypothetical protein PLQ54_01295 [Armatimonadota bacterium]|nr:hypothetical protein [Armatimonadota bacterium]